MNEIRAGNGHRIARLAMQEAQAAQGKGAPLTPAEAAELKQARLGLTEQVQTLLTRKRETTITVAESQKLKELEARAAELAKNAKPSELQGAARAEYDALKPLMPKSTAWIPKEPPVVGSPF